MLGMRSAQAADISMLTDMGKYMNLVGGSNDSVHAPITNIIWWCWNANSAQARYACILHLRHDMMSQLGGTACCVWSCTVFAP